MSSLLLITLFSLLTLNEVLSTGEQNLATSLLGSKDIVRAAQQRVMAKREIREIKRNVFTDKMYEEQMIKIREKLMPLFVIKTTRVGGIKACKYVRGVTSLYDRIYVICSNSDVIQVYDGKTYLEVDAVEFPGGKNLHDIASCKLTGNLYVVEAEKQEDTVSIWVSRISRSTGKLGEWKMWKSGKFWSHSISVSPRGRVILLSKTTLHVFDHGGVEVKTIDLPGAILNPRHAVETHDENYVVCHGWDDKHHGITLLSGSGRVLRAYGGISDPREGEDRLTKPSHLAVDDEGRVFVADQVNYRILVLTADLKYARELLNAEEDDTVWPSRIYYDDIEHRLIVGLTSGNPRIDSVLVFSITSP